MRPFKKLLKSDAVRHILCWIGAQYIRFVWATGRWRTEGSGEARRLWDAGEPFVLAFWHGRLLMMPYCWDRSKTIHMLISQHRDGQIIANVVRHFGIRWMAGSSSKGGAQALRGMLKALKGGEYVGITPDGPRGPRMRASDGVVSVARMSGAPVLPATFGARRGKVLRSWDRFLVAWPFSSGVIVWGEPVRVERDADEAAVEAARDRIEAELNRITAEADRLTGREPVEPARESWRGAA